MQSRYNLRSTTHEDTHITMELQLAGDGMFLSQTLGSSHPEPRQVTTLQSESTSESDSEVSFVDELGSRRNSLVKNSGSGNFVRAGQSAGDSSGNGLQNSGQDHINNQILEQLSQNNKNACLHKKSHETKGIFYKHVCSACFVKEGKSFVHSQVDCRTSK